MSLAAAPASDVRLAGLFRALAQAFRPPPQVTVSQWADAKRRLAPEASPYPGPWRTALVPYMREVMDCLSLSHPCEVVTLKKSAQVAGSEAGLNLLGYIVDVAPAPVLVLLPTFDEAKKYNKLKLGPAIEATPVLRAKVAEQKSRDDKGSTTLLKRFPGGFLVITGANSSAGLQMVSVRVIVEEEISEYPPDVDGRGDPVELAEKRNTAYRETGVKVFKNSTPGLKGACRVSEAYDASDRRRYLVPCPHCGAEQPLVFGQLKFNESEPHDARYACAECGVLIGPAEKRAMVGAGRWEAQAPGAGRQPGFHINQLYSPFVSWDQTAREWLAAKGDPVKEKVFTQQVLGEAYEAKGDAPDYLKLFARREEYPLGQVPPGVLFLTAAADVQHNRLEFAVWGWGRGKTRWLVDRGVLPGDTSDPDGEAWRALEEVRARRYASAWGRQFEVEAMAVDSGDGARTQAVYSWCRRRGPRVMAVKGMPGHLAPPLGTPQRVDVNFRGERIKGGALVWPIGVWMLKAELYAQLRKTIEGPADGVFPPGYVHLSADLDESWLQQLTAEYLVSEERRGFIRQVWVKPAGVANEALDVAVYAAAAAEHLGLSRLTTAQWEALAAERGAPDPAAQPELFAPALTPKPAAAPAIPQPSPPRGARGLRGRIEVN